MNQIFSRFFFSRLSVLLFFIILYSCNAGKPGKEEKIVEKPFKINPAVAVQLEELLKGITDTMHTNSLKIYNPYSVKAHFENNYDPLFTSKMAFTDAGMQLKKFIDSGSKFFGLFPKTYHADKIKALYNDLTMDDNKKKDAVAWAKAEIYFTDALFQIAKHVKNGRLYEDTNYRYFDTALTKNVFTPLLEQFIKQPSNLNNLLSVYEPRFHDYDSLKIFLKKLILETASGEKEFSAVIFPYNDSLKFVKSLICRFKEEGLAQTATEKVDSLQLSAFIREYQVKYTQTPTGKYSKEMIDNMNIKSNLKFTKIALTMDKFKNFRIPNKGDYVLVNIPSFTLRGYTKTAAAVESRVAVGKRATKTPIMESEISDIIIMPMWYVPQSIAKAPGYIERKRRNHNYIVKGKSVIQKAGPGNALGEMKFNFKSSDDVYLHDTNEKWVFGSTNRAVSHGCVRVQNYKNLASFITSLTPVMEKDYVRVLDKLVIDPNTADTSYKYKYVVADSMVYKTDTIPGMLKRKVHRELVVMKKVPIYIKYFTCAIRNGVFVMYNDVYGYDKVLQEKYFSNIL